MKPKDVCLCVCVYYKYKTETIFVNVQEWVCVIHC